MSSSTRRRYRCDRCEMEFDSREALVEHLHRVGLVE
jgi:hypothetical protein